MSDLLPYRTLPSAVAQELRDRIISGVLSAGSKIDQKALGTEFGVSRMPIREALRQLDAEGFVTLVPHRGAVVSELRPEEIEEAYEIRAVLEGLACSLAVKRLGEADLARLGEILDAFNRVQSTQEWLRLNIEFHGTLERPCGRPRLLEQIGQLRRQAQPYVRMYVQYLHQDVQADREHAEILDAARARDSVRMESLVRQHILATGRTVARHVALSRRA